MYNPFNRAEENAVMHFVFLIADADCVLHESERALITLLGMKFGFSQSDLTNAVCMSESMAVSTLSLMTPEKKQLAACLFTAAAMADGNTRLMKPEMSKCSDIIKKCSLPRDIKFTDSVRIAHEFLDR